MRLKQLIRKTLPPFIFEARIALINWIRETNTIGKKPFEKWWKMTRKSPNIPGELRAMVDHFCTTDDANLMSKFWWFLAQKNIQQLESHGYDNFKQTVARNYYTWVGNDAEVLMSSVFADIETASTDFGSLQVDSAELFRLHSLFTTKESLDFNLNTVLFYCHIRKTFGREVSIIEEPSEGNPPAISLDARMVSQDILNSFLDYVTISKCCDFSKINRVLELGAGYGRTAHYIITQQPQLAYIIVDIPPALYISQRYLTHQFPDKPHLLFNPDLTAADIQRALDKGSLIFLTPDQIECINDKQVDLAIAIDNLHAMSNRQVDAYFSQFNRLCSLFYFTYWPGMGVPFDSISYDSSKWPIRESWKLIHESRTTIPSCYVNACYSI